MPLLAADRVKVIWTGTGSGTMTLGAAVPGFQAFPSTLNNTIVSYAIEHQTAAEAESGFGVYTSSGTTLTRQYRTFPTKGGSAVIFSPGEKHVRLTKISVEECTTSTSNPSVTDDVNSGFLEGRSSWLNTSTNALYFCCDHTAGAAVWTQIGGAGGGAVSSVNGQTGTVVLDADDIEGAYNSPANYAISGTTIRSHIVGIDTALGGGLAADAAPAQIVSNSTTFTLPISGRMHTNAEILSHASNVDFEVPATTAAGSKWLIYPLHSGCNVSVVGNAGSVNGTAGGTARIILNGLAIAEVRSNSGSAPVVVVRGNVIVAPIDVGTTKTYTNDDSDQEYRLTSTSTQTIPASSNLAQGFDVILYRETAGTITVAGSDANYTISGPDIVNVTKVGTAMLASGKAGVVILDAA